MDCVLDSDEDFDVDYDFDSYKYVSKARVFCGFA